MSTQSRATRGFTLLEVLIAVLILGIIATAALPMLGSYTEKAREAREEANFELKAKAMERYELDHTAPLGFVWDASTSEMVEYGMATAQGPTAQLQFPTDANGNVMGDPVSASPGPSSYGPYVAQMPAEPASVLLANAGSGNMSPIMSGDVTWFAGAGGAGGAPPNVWAKAANLKNRLSTPGFAKLQDQAIAALEPVFQEDVPPAAVRAFMVGVSPDDRSEALGKWMAAMAEAIKKGKIHRERNNMWIEPQGGNVAEKYLAIREQEVRLEVLVVDAETARGHFKRVYRAEAAPGVMASVFSALTSEAQSREIAQVEFADDADRRVYYRDMWPLAVAKDVISTTRARVEERIKTYPSDSVQFASLQKYAKELVVAASANKQEITAAFLDLKVRVPNKDLAQKYTDEKGEFMIDTFMDPLDSWKATQPLRQTLAVASRGGILVADGKGLFVKTYLTPHMPYVTTNSWDEYAGSIDRINNDLPQDIERIQSTEIPTDKRTLYDELGKTYGTRPDAPSIQDAAGKRYTELYYEIKAVTQDLDKTFRLITAFIPFDAKSRVRVDRGATKEFKERAGIKPFRTRVELGRQLDLYVESGLKALAK